MHKESCPPEQRGSDHFMDGASLGIVKARQKYFERLPGLLTASTSMPP